MAPPPFELGFLDYFGIAFFLLIVIIGIIFLILDCIIECEKQTLYQLEEQRRIARL